MPKSWNFNWKAYILFFSNVGKIRVRKTKK